jgi:hypothetical protein
MIGGSGTKVLNKIARSRIDLSYFIIRNVPPQSV